MVDVVIAGAAGRMGCRLVALIQAEKDLHLAAALEAPGHPSLLRDAGEVAGVGKLGIPISADPEGALGRDRVLIEFSIPDASLGHLRMAARQGARAVIGTTGFAAAQRAEISEMHHRFKKDAPSGTAARMAEIVAQALGRDLSKTGVYGRHGLPGERPHAEIGIHSIRGGDVVGEHTVTFAALGERLELTHRSQSRDNFAHGALRAARFIAQAGPGLYSMQDVLKLG